MTAGGPPPDDDGDDPAAAGAPGRELGDEHLAAMQDAELAALTTRPDLPPAFERRHLDLAPGVERSTSQGEWAGSLVRIAAGELEVTCDHGGRLRFLTGDLLVLGWLPLRSLRNPGRVPTRLVALRRRGERVPDGLLRVVRFIRREA